MLTVVIQPKKPVVAKKSQVKKKIKCKGLKKTKDPKCNNQEGCNWVTKKGCLSILPPSYNQYSKYLKISISDLKKLVSEKDPMRVNTLTKKEQKIMAKIPPGTPFEELISVLYLMYKHKDDCYPIIKSHFDKLFIKKSSDISRDYPTSDNKIDARYQLIWIDNIKMLYIGALFKLMWRNCIKSKKRFIFIFFGIFGEVLGGVTRSWAHSNCLIYDTKTKELERFEPHGSVTFYNNKALDDAITNQLEPIVNFKKYYKPLDFCPSVNFQKMPSLKKIGVDPSGFCAYWTIWYMDMRLLNPDKPRNELIEESILKIEQMIKKKKDTDFGSFIRTYAIFLNVILKLVIGIVNDPNNKDENKKDLVDKAIKYIIDVTT